MDGSSYNMCMLGHSDLEYRVGALIKVPCLLLITQCALHMFMHSRRLKFVGQLSCLKTAQSPPHGTAYNPKLLEICY